MAAPAAGTYGRLSVEFGSDGMNGIGSGVSGWVMVVVPIGDMSAKETPLALRGVTSLAPLFRKIPGER